MMSETKKILIVDDDPGICELLQRYLIEQGLTVSAVHDGQEMDAYLNKQQVDLIILDLMLPGEDGLSIARRLRTLSDMPIIILSAKGEDIERIIGLEMGADDYLAKPFNPRELLARIHAVLRRRQSQHAETRQGDNEKHYMFGHFKLNLSSRTLRENGEVIELTSGEFDILEVFIRHPNQVLSRDQLVDQLNGYERSPFDRSIDVRVTRLRKKIEADNKQVQYIRTVRGIGYMFTPKGNG
jgi:DNA-binding response OmpR family regulator